MWKTQRVVPVDGNQKVFPEVIKEALLSDFALARCVTRSFRILKANPLQILIQLKKNAISDRDKLRLSEKFKAIITDYAQIEADVQLISYIDSPHGMELTYQQKI